MGCHPSKVGDAAFKYKPVTIDDFRVLEIIGKGTFGKVCIIERKSDHVLYALKYSSKEKCIQEKASAHIIAERNLLEKIRHKFICNLRYSFQDDEFLYMILDLMRGGDLRFHLKTRRFSEKEARSIMCECISALQYLHSNNIVHRDIKPDNVLLDNHGHAYLSDFNVAIQFSENRPLRSIAGTEPYMAPEMIMNLGYGSPIDWWSLGVMLFEMVCGERPFRSKMRKEFIKRCKYRFPDSAANISEVCKTLIQGFLQLDPRRRLGSGREGLYLLMEHPFFEGIAWMDVENKKLRPIYVPPEAAANFKTDADATDLQKYLHQRRRFLPGQSSLNHVHSIFQEFSYYDSGMLKQTSPIDPPTIPSKEATLEFSTTLPRTDSSDSDRVNLNFDTTNSSGHRWMSRDSTGTRRLSVGSQMSAIRKTSMRGHLVDSQIKHSVNSPDGHLGLPLTNPMNVSNHFSSSQASESAYLSSTSQNNIRPTTYKPARGETVYHNKSLGGSFNAGTPTSNIIPTSPHGGPVPTASPVRNPLLPENLRRRNTINGLVDRHGNNTTPQRMTLENSKEALSPLAIVSSPQGHDSSSQGNGSQANIRKHTIKSQNGKVYPLPPSQLDITPPAKTSISVLKTNPPQGPGSLGGATPPDSDGQVSQNQMGSLDKAVHSSGPSTPPLIANNNIDSSAENIDMDQRVAVYPPVENELEQLQQNPPLMRSKTRTATHGSNMILLHAINEEPNGGRSSDTSETRQDDSKGDAIVRRPSFKVYSEKAHHHHYQPQSPPNQHHTSLQVVPSLGPVRPTQESASGGSESNLHKNDTNIQPSIRTSQAKLADMLEELVPRTVEPPSSRRVSLGEIGTKKSTTHLDDEKGTSLDPLSHPPSSTPQKLNSEPKFVM